MDAYHYNFKTWLRYKFDNFMSKGPAALIGGLGLLSLVVIVVGALIMVLAGISTSPESEEGVTFIEGAWLSLMRTLDAGTMGGDEGWAFRAVAFAVTLGGVFIISTLIGVLTSGIEAKLGELRKGKSFVVEKDHTLILGWSSKIFTLISELITANENRKNAVIVVLADRDKVEMEEELKMKIGNFKNTRMICRSGSPNDMDHLNIVNPNTARSIVVLSPEDDNPDAQVIKTILAITNNPNRRKEPYHIVAEIKEKENYDVAMMVGKSELCAILSDELISRITVQTCRHSGLSVVFIELLDFGGVEIYFQNEPSLTGKTFRDAVLAYEDSAIFGLRRADGSIILNPPPDTRIAADDKVIAISEDDDTVVVSGRTDFGIDTSAIVQGVKEAAHTDKTLILGWNHKAASIIMNLDDYVAAGSELLVIANSDHYQDEVEEVTKHIKNQTIEFRKGDTTDRELLDAINVSRFHNVVILCYSDVLDVQAADSLTLITLLHLRDIAEKTGVSVNVVSEMLDIRNRELATVTKVDDFIVSDKITSLMLAQLSENKELKAVFDDLFDEEGNEIYLKPITNYVRTDRPVNFYTVVESALQKREVAIGYKIYAHRDDASQGYGIVVDPKKSDVIAFEPQDKLIVIAEN